MQDIYMQFAETLGKFTKAQSKEFATKRAALLEGSSNMLTIEVQLNMAEAILGVPVTKPVFIPKNNGATQTESFSEGFLEGGDPISSDKQLLVKSYMLTCQINEADARRALNLPPTEIAAMGRHVVADYYLAKSGGTLTEAQCIEVAKKRRPVRR